MADALTVDVTRRFQDGVVVAARFAVSIRTGAIVLLFGPSGSGKTTVVRAIAGLDQPEQGVISFGGERWFDADQSTFVAPQLRRIGYVFQEPSLFPHLDVRGNVEYGVRHLAANERNARVDRLLGTLALADLATRYPRQLSGGQAQRVALGRALAPGPRLLLLDEPFASLDTPARGSLRSVLRHTVEHLGIACILVTHDRTEAIALGDEMVVLAEGQVRQVGPVADVFRRPADLVVARSVGVESVLPATVERIENGLVELRVGGVVLRAADVGREGPVREVFACVRAEDVTLERSATQTASARNHLPGRVVSIDREGPVERVALDCGFPLVALITRHAREEMGLEQGVAVTAAVKATAVHLVSRS